MPTISDVIRHEMTVCGESRYKVSQETGIEQSALSRFMSGERGLSMEALDVLAEYFGYKLVKTKAK